jgi:hypothetical protein
MVKQSKKKELPEKATVWYIKSKTTQEKGTSKKGNIMQYMKGHTKILQIKLLIQNKLLMQNLT